LQRLRSVAGRVTIAELLARALEETAFLATLTGLPDGARRVGNVEKLVEIARRSARIGLGDFTAYLQDLSDREAREGEALVETEGAVKLMTIHASKGLEFPVVALIDASWERKPDSVTLMADPVLGPVCSVRDETGEKQEPFAYRLAKTYAENREEAERKRLLYVGMTRAQDYLIVSGRKIPSESKAGRKTWLKQLMAILELPDSIEPDEQRIVPMSWGGECLLRIPQTEPKPEQLIPRMENSSTAWERLSEPLPNVLDSPDSAYSPPLLRAVPRDRFAPARMLSATEIAMLGEARALPDTDKFRQHILRSAPISIREVANPDIRSTVPLRIIGEIVHQALRWSRFPNNTPDLEKILQNYAWEHGIIDPQMLQAAVEEAYKLLERTQNSRIFAQMAEATQVYRELPFVYRLGERTINGVIDVLFFSKYHQWNIIDYKTSAVHGMTSIVDDLATHSARYYAQLGIYAAAVEEMTGQTPDTYLHYIRYVYTVKIESEQWREAISHLNDDIESALGDEAQE
jgi:ATP-dependent helicase/nuclease subunit A